MRIQKWTLEAQHNVQFMFIPRKADKMCNVP